MATVEYHQVCEQRYQTAGKEKLQFTCGIFQKLGGACSYHFLSSTGIRAPVIALRPPSVTMTEGLSGAAGQTCALIDALVFAFEHPEPKLLSNSVNQLQYCSSLCILHI